MAEVGEGVISLNTGRRRLLTCTVIRRYTLFYVLYPLGAGSEAYLMYISIPWAKYKYGKPGMFGLMGLVMLWPPGKPCAFVIWCIANLCLLLMIL